MSKNGMLFILVLMIFPTAIPASDFTDKHSDVADAIELLEIWIEEQMTFRDVPGLAIGIVYDQELIWSAGYGFADRDAAVPVTSKTLFRIASITKTFTATAIMQLRDAGKLRLDDPITNYLPWFEIQNPFPGAPAITVRHLATHSSGLPREAAYPYWTDHKFPTLEEIKAKLPEMTMVYPPGQQYKYSNLGLALLGAVVASASGEAYADYIHSHIFNPLGMTSSQVLPDSDTKGIAQPYLRRMPDGSRTEGYFLKSEGITPAANIASNIEDLAKYAALQFRSGPAGGEQILKGYSLDEMHRAQVVYDSWSGGRAIGFGVTHRNGKTLVSHGGWAGNHRTHFMFNPEEKIAVIALINTEDAKPYRYSYEAYDLVGPAIIQAVSAPDKKDQAEAVWKRYVGDYVDTGLWDYKVLIHKNRLVLYEYNYPPEEHATSNLTYLIPAGKHTFRMPDGENLVFEMEKGKVVRIRWRYDYIYPAPMDK